MARGQSSATASRPTARPRPCSLGSAFPSAVPPGWSSNQSLLAPTSTATFTVLARRSLLKRAPVHATRDSPAVGAPRPSSTRPLRADLAGSSRKAPPALQCARCLFWALSDPLADFLCPKDPRRLATGSASRPVAGKTRRVCLFKGPRTAVFSALVPTLELALGTR